MTDDTIESLRAELAAHKRALAAGPAALREGAPSLWSGEAAAREVERAQAEAMDAGMTDDTIESLRAKLAEAGARAEHEHAEMQRQAKLAVDWMIDAQRALAACAELRAALEPFAIFCAAFDGKHSNLARKADDPIYCFNDVAITLGMVRTARALLARTDLGRGMVAVPREVVARAAIAIRALLDHRAHRSSCARCDPARDAVAALDALLDGGKERG